MGKSQGSDENAKDSYGKTPLHWAACNGHKMTRAGQCMLKTEDNVAYPVLWLYF